MVMIRQLTVPSVVVCGDDHFMIRQLTTRILNIDLPTTTSSIPSVVVCGDDHSGAHQLVDALLQSTHQDINLTIDNSPSAILSADVLVLVSNPLTTPVNSIPLHSHPNTILVLTSLTPPPGLPFPHNILCIDPYRALHALDTLKSNPASPLAIQRYQDDFTASNISALTSALKLALPPNYNKHTALSRAALDACSRSLTSTQHDLDALSTDISHLRARAELERTTVHNNVLRSRSHNALAHAESHIRALFLRLSWSRAVWRVDDISSILSNALDRSWCTDLERHLILHTGKLTTLQQSFTDSAYSLLSSSPITSPLLRNHLDQLRANPAYPLTHRTLTAPIHARRAQLAHPTARLHLAAQNALLRMTAGSVVSAAAATAVAVSTETAGLGTAVGVGVLGAVAATRWAVGIWERAKLAWWRDWKRVGEGLDRDLKTTLDKTMDDNVLVVAERASAGLQELVRNRTEEVEQLKEDIHVLRSEIESRE